MKAPKPRHWFLLAVLIVTLLPAIWFVMAYAGLPRLWSRHEQKLMADRHQLVSYTSQDIPGDPINLRIRGSKSEISCAFSHGGWTSADDVTVGSGLKIAESVVFHRPYPQAPVSPLYLADREEDVAFEREEGKSADKRHHVRLWRIGDEDWLAAASFDRGVGLSLFTLQITHRIGPDVDRERDMIGTLLLNSGGKSLGTMGSGVPGGVWHRNGGGNCYRTDGIVKVFAAGQTCKM